MDLGAYARIGDLSEIMKENHISVPRLRGLRYMGLEEPVPRDMQLKKAKFNGLWDCQRFCRSNFQWNSNWSEYSTKTDRIIHKYFIVDDDDQVVDIKWDAVHGQKRKYFKYAMRMAKKHVFEQFAMFNKYAGCKDVLYIHARIGGCNRNFYGVPGLTKKDWFLDMIDDAFDSTYCDIYARINPPELTE